MTERIANIFLASSTALLMALPISAETYTTEAKIPFAFQANGRALAAGKYEVREDTSKFVSIRNHTTGRLIFLSNHAGINDGQAPARLVFHRYGEKYFLAEVWSPESKGTVLAPSKAEKELTSSGAPEQTAVIVMNSRSKAD